MRIGQIVAEILSIIKTRNDFIYHLGFEPEVEICDIAIIRRIRAMVVHQCKLGFWSRNVVRVRVSLCPYFHFVIFLNLLLT
jgi:hypothetical protein